MNWYYAEGSQQIGPVDQAQFNSMVANGRIRGDTLVWHSGMPNWAPYSTVAGQSGAAAAGSMASGGAAAFGAGSAGVPSPSYSPTPSQYQPGMAGPAAGGVPRYCAECGTVHNEAEMVRFGDSYVCGNCKNVFAQKLREGVRSTANVRYGGFWIRVLALLIDGVILTIVNMILSVALIGIIGIGRNPGDLSPVKLMLMFVVYLVQIAIYATYEAWFLSNKGATPGKMALGLRVVRASGAPISLGLGYGRFFSRIVDSITLGIGYVIAAFDEEKRTLHDRIVDTRVIYR